MLKLYTSPGVCATACHIALQESGVPFETKVVEFESGFFDSKEFLAVNVKGYVPFLEIGQGRSLTEGTAILQYIAAQAPEKNLIPAKGFEHFKALEWLNFVATEIHKPMGSLFAVESLIPDTASRKHYVTAVTNRLQDHFSLLNTTLEKHQFILGDHYSVVDAYAFTILTWAKHLNIDLSKYKNVGSFQNRIYERPATQRAFKAEGILN